MPVIGADPFGAFISGRAARQDEEYAGYRNQLAQQDVQNAADDRQRRNALFQMQQQQYSQEQVTQALQQTAATALRLAQSPNIRQEFQQYPEFAQGLLKQHPEMANMGDDELRQYMSFVAGQAQSKLGIAPQGPDPKIELERQKLQQGQQQFDARLAFDQEKLRQDARLANQKPANTYRTLSAQEVADAGLPVGTSAQVDANGKIDVLSKRDLTGSLSQKDASTARNKLTSIRLAKAQLQKVKDAFEQGKGGMGGAAFGGFGQGLIPTPGGKKFDALVDQMRSTWTGIKRVPGVGSMSDYESKMDNAQFPSRNDFESTIDTKLQGMEDQLALLENGYTNLLSGGGEQQVSRSQGSAPPEAIAYLKAHPELRGAFQQKYGYLP